MRRIILTGGISSGKSTVVEMLKEDGIKVVDGDKISFTVFNENIDNIKEIFETDLNGDELRKYVSNEVFSKPKKRLALEALLHPIIRERIEEEHQSLASEKHILDLPLYFERSPKQPDDYVVLVAVPYKTQLERLMKRNNFTKEEADKRILSQMPTAVKAKRSDLVIDNSGDLEKLKKQTLSLIAEVFD